jgi:hypothetical protein
VEDFRLLDRLFETAPGEILDFISLGLSLDNEAGTSLDT